MNIIKRDGSLDTFNVHKIYEAIMKAMKYGSGLVDQDLAKLISNEIQQELESKDHTTINEVENLVYLKLTEAGHISTAKEYEGYRAIQSFKRSYNTTDESIIGLLDMTNKEVMNENSNKNSILISTQRDLIAGEISKDISKRKIIPTRIIQAHNNGSIWFHDMDYAMQKAFNCCLIDIQDMLDNGTAINKRKIDSPNSFQVACTVLTQVIAQVASSQYGGQSVNIKHLGKYLRKTKERYMKLLEDTIENVSDRIEAVNKLTRKELESGIQTIQYQINTLMTTNG